MKVLWLCNIIPPVIAKELNLEASNKEGWISGLCDTILKKNAENKISLSIASPVGVQKFPQGHAYFRKEIPVAEGSLTFYGFREDTEHPENYDPALEGYLGKILLDCEPELVHCFGTEYPHTLAMCRALPQKDRLLIHIQGLCAVYANAYFANLPEKIINSVTLRDFLKSDSLRQQKQKFTQRGKHEIEAIRLAGNIACRTGWDRYYTRKWNSSAQYFKMYETLRPDFYQDTWQEDQCIPHSIFLSQGDYPIKGLHYMLAAMPDILRRFPDTKVYVAGNSIVNYRTVKQKLKISAYGRYLRKLMQQYSLDEKIVFLGKLTAAEMKARYLKSHLFVCCSSVENSPNSLGEAMMLGMPCVAADVGGIPDLFTEKSNYGSDSDGDTDCFHNGKQMGVDPEFGVCSGSVRHSEHLSRITGQNSSGGDDPEFGLRDGLSGVKTGGILYKGFECPENEYGYTGIFSGSEEEKMREIAGNLSEAVIEIWKNDRKLSDFCKNARELASKNHDRERNYMDLIHIYDQIMDKNQND